MDTKEGGCKPTADIRDDVPTQDPRSHLNG